MRRESRPRRALRLQTRKAAQGATNTPGGRRQTAYAGQLYRLYIIKFGGKAQWIMQK